MDNTKLTRDADALICVLYKSYIDRRKSGISKIEARYFAGSDYIHETLMAKWSFEDVDETCRELSRAEFLLCRYGDDVVCDAMLTDEAIIYMENRFKDGLASLLDHLEKLWALIPW